MTFLYAALLQSMLVTGGTEASYNNAYAAAQQSGLPLVVLIGTDANQDYQTMKQDVMPQLQSNGSLDKVAFAAVSTDSEAVLARKLTGSDNSMPQLVMYYQSAAGWQRRKLSGAASASEVSQFISSGLQAANSPVSTSRTFSPTPSNAYRSYAPTNSFNGFRSFGGFGGRICIGGS